MSVRPNITSLELDGTKLTVRGEAEDPLATLIHVVVVQDGAAGAGQTSAFGLADRAGSGWRATLTDTSFKKGPAEVLGIEVFVAPFQVTSWIQSDLVIE